jgi:hypothetical protein
VKLNVQEASAQERVRAEVIACGPSAVSFAGKGATEVFFPACAGNTVQPGK